MLQCLVNPDRELAEVSSILEEDGRRLGAVGTVPTPGSEGPPPHRARLPVVLCPNAPWLPSRHPWPVV